MLSGVEDGVKPEVFMYQMDLLLQKGQGGGGIHPQVFRVWLTIVCQVRWPVPYHEQVQELQNNNDFTTLT